MDNVNQYAKNDTYRQEDIGIGNRTGHAIGPRLAYGHDLQLVGLG